MNRRTLLGLLAGIPFLGGIVAAKEKEDEWHTLCFVNFIVPERLMVLEVSAEEKNDLQLIRQDATSALLDFAATNRLIDGPGEFRIKSSPVFRSSDLIANYGVRYSLQQRKPIAT